MLIVHIFGFHLEISMHPYVVPWLCPPSSDPELEGIVSNQISQTQKARHPVFSFIYEK